MLSGKNLHMMKLAMFINGGQYSILPFHGTQIYFFATTTENII